MCIRITSHNTHPPTHTHTHTHLSLCSNPPPPKKVFLGMHGDGLWGDVGHTSTQFVSCCSVVGSQGQEPWYVGGICTYGALCPLGLPPCRAEHWTHGLQQW